jgi:hypothetical protein
MPQALQEDFILMYLIDNTRSDWKWTIVVNERMMDYVSELVRWEIFRVSEIIWLPPMKFH